MRHRRGGRPPAAVGFPGARRPPAAVLPGLVVALAVLASPASAQRYHVRTYTETDGLPSSTVSGMAQSADGRLWFATRSGIAAFDGVDWVTYDTNDGLPSKVQLHVVVDSSDRIWAVGRPGSETIATLEGDRWVPVPPPDGRGPIVASVAASTDGSPWFALARASGPVVVTQGDGWREVQRETGEPARGRSLAVAGGRLLIGADDGVWSVDPRTERGAVLLEAAGPDSVRGLAADPSGGIWIFRNDAFGLLRDGRWETRARWTCPEPYGVVRAAADGRGGVMFGTVRHVFLYHPSEGIEALDHHNGLVSDGVSGVLVDREGCPWISCGRGVTRLVDRAFASWGRMHGLLEDEVTAILRRSDGTMLLGHSGGITFFTDGPSHSIPFEDPAMRVLDWTEDARGVVWATTGKADLLRIDAEDRLTRIEVPRRLGRVATAVHRFSDGEIWVAGESFLARLRAGRLERMDLPMDLGGCYPRRFVETSNGDRYLATSRGVFRHRPDGWTRLHVDADAHDVYALQERPTGEIWWGSSIGLFRLDGERLTRVDAPALDRPVYFLQDDRDGNTWIGTDNGVFLWNGVSVRHFTVQDGLAGRETNRSACFRDEAGRMWIGTDGGLSIYRPAFRPLDRADPIVTLLPPSAHGDPLVRGSDGVFVTDDPSVSFPFRAVLFERGGDLPVRFRLHGLEERWSEPRPARLRPLQYPKLPAGTYRLELQAEGPFGWSESSFGEPVEVRGPLWQRPWFLVLVAIVALASVGAFVTAAVQSRFAHRLQRDVRARTEELSAQKERLSITLGGIADGVIATDLSGAVTLMNRAAERITGWPIDEALGRRVAEVLVLDGDSVDLDTDGGISSVLKLRKHDGTTCSAEVSLAGVREDGRRSGSVYVFRDVTERVRSEEERIRSQKMEAVGVLAGGIAHNFNNLLMVMLGRLSMLEATAGISDDMRDQIHEARIAAQRSRSLTRQLLTFAQGGLPVRSPQPIGEVLREAARFASTGAAATVVFDIPDDLALVEIDADQMGQVIGNLVINARQAMPDGGTIHIRARNLAPAPPPLRSPAAVRIEVEDEGSGIPPELLDRLFEPYFSTKRNGTGLGLAASDSIVRKHDGHLSAESPPGRGAIFRIDLPASSRPADAVPEAGPRPDAGGGRILVMDDDDLVRRALEGMLGHLGYEVACTEEGREAVERYREASRDGTPFDVVVLDLTVAGGMGGREAAEAIRRFDPGARMVAASGYSRDPLLADPGRFGFRAALEKPFLVEDLARVLRDVLGSNGAT